MARVRYFVKAIITEIKNAKPHLAEFSLPLIVKEVQLEFAQPASIENVFRPKCYCCFSKGISSVKSYMN
jgi:hypothetical protein